MEMRDEAPTFHHWRAHLSGRSSNGRRSCACAVHEIRSSSEEDGPSGEESETDEVDATPPAGPAVNRAGTLVPHLSVRADRLTTKLTCPCLERDHSN